MRCVSSAFHGHLMLMSAIWVEQLRTRQGQVVTEYEMMTTDVEYKKTVLNFSFGLGIKKIIIRNNSYVQKMSF